MSDVTETMSDTPQTGAWLRLEDAARFLKVSVRTVDRRGLMKRREPGQPVEVWVSGATSDDVSAIDETPSEPVRDPVEQAMVLSDIVSDMVRQQEAPLVAALERAEQRLAESETRSRQLAREYGQLEEKNAALRRVVDVVQQMSDADRRDADTARQEAEALAERAARAEALADERGRELERLRERSWLDRLLGW